MAETPSGSQQTPVPKTQIFSEQEPMTRLVHETRAQLQVANWVLASSLASRAPYGQLGAVSPTD